MQQLFLKREHHSRLLLFFAGWGSDEQLFNRPVAEGWDCLLCFDYRSMDFDYTLLDGYQEIRLLAWSMGVWAAGCVLGGRDYPWEQKVAFNGTVCPIDDACGIPRAIFKGTLDQFGETTLVRFRRRICGTTAQVKEFLSHNPYRLLDDLREELACLWEQVRLLPTPSFGWDKAIIGTSDKIFPPANQRQAWQGTDVVERAVEHYDGRLFADLLTGEDEVWTRR